MCVQCDVKVVGGMYLNIVFVVCFVVCGMLSLLINVVVVFIVHSYYKARC